MIPESLRGVAIKYTTNGLKLDPSGKPLPVNGERL
jgi:hypothetical protein